MAYLYNLLPISYRVIWNHVHQAELPKINKIALKFDSSIFSQYSLIHFSPWRFQGKYMLDNGLKCVNKND